MRLDFISDRDYLPEMTKRGYNACFLPLGTDPSMFYPVEGSYKRDSSFVGSSYYAQVDEFASMAEELLLEMVPFLAALISQYRQNNEFDIGEKLSAKISSMLLPENMSFEKAVFIM